MSATRLIVSACLLVSACSTREMPSRDRCEIAESVEDYSGCDVDGCLDPSQCTEVDWAYGNGGLCTRTCESELDCPSVGGHHGRCIQIEGIPSFICVKSCELGVDCSSGQVCQPLAIGGSVCLP